jgi:hypothetical protein
VRSLLRRFGARSVAAMIAAGLLVVGLGVAFLTSDLGGGEDASDTDVVEREPAFDAPDAIKLARRDPVADCLIYLEGEAASGAANCDRLLDDKRAEETYVDCRAEGTPPADCLAAAEGARR